MLWKFCLRCYWIILIVKLGCFNITYYFNFLSKGHLLVKKYLDM